MCVEMVRTFYLASRLVPVQIKTTHRKFYVYSIVSWTVPTFIVGCSIILNYTTSGVIQYGWNVEIESRYCWINDFYSAVITVLIPIALSTCLQLILFIVVGILILSSAETKVRMPPQVERALHTFEFYSLSFFASNIMWVFGFVALLIGMEWAWYPFEILLNCQGFVIFLGFFGTKKVLKLYTTTFTKFFDTLHFSTKNTAV